MLVREVGELAEVGQIETELRGLIRAMVKAAEQRDTVLFSERNSAFEARHNRYCMLRRIDSSIQYGTSDVWDVARNKVATYFTYLLNGYGANPRFLNEALAIVRNAA